MGGIIAQYVALNYQQRVLSLTCIYSTSGDPGLPPAKKEVLDFFASSMNSEEQSLESIVNHKLRLFKIYNNLDYIAVNRAHYPAGFKRVLLAMICAAPINQ